jgi:hypothetical protein
LTRTAHQRHFDERLATTIGLEPACARGEISHGYAIYAFGATSRPRPLLILAILPLLEIM